jgi:hypothetical protein
MMIRRSKGRNQDAEAPSIGSAAIAGVLATYGMDFGTQRIVAPALRMTPPSNLGRWIGHMFKGRFTHEDISKAEPIAHEARIALAAHYTIGLVLGAGYALLLQVQVPQSRQSTLSRAAAYGAATTVFPWFWMFPARGQGVMGLRDRDLRVPAFALCTHIVYGLGLGAALRFDQSKVAERCRSLLA